MNIGIFISSYLPKMGGAQVSTHCLSKSLVNIGHKVVIFTDKRFVNQCKKNNWNFNYEIKGIKVPRNLIRKLSLNIWRSQITKLLKNAIRVYNLDIVQIINAWPWVCFKNDPVIASVPLLLRAVGDDIQKNEKLNYGMLRNSDISDLVLSGYDSISTFVANSETTKNEYLKLGVDISRIKIITPGVDNDIFKNTLFDKAEILKKYNLPKGKKIILAVGRNHKKKGYKYLVKALKNINSIKNKFVLVIVGKDTNSLTELATQIHEEENFYPIKEISSIQDEGFTSFPSKQLVHLYQISDYFVLPSILETFGNVKLEAMASGTPVIVSNAPGARDAIEHEVNGLIVPPNSSESISGAILKLENDHKLKSKIVKNEINFSRDHDWEKVALKYIELYSESKTGVK